MIEKRLEFALELADSKNWRLFEDFAGKFLGAEFAAYRPVASESGDKGRDGELFSCEQRSNVLFQISVQKTWQQKIISTARRVRENFPNSTILVYVTNQDIGPKADDVKAKVSDEFSLYVDVRDRNWFLQRAEADQARQIASEQFAQALVDPLLAKKEIIDSKGLALSHQEAKAGLIYLELQWEDDTREKGLTKTCFEALVRSALRESTPEDPISHKGVLDRVCQVLPSHRVDDVDRYVKGALERLRRSCLTYFKVSDSYCFNFHERERLLERLAALEVEERQFDSEWILVTEEIADNEDERTALGRFFRKVAEKVLLKRGEQFVDAIIRETAPTLAQNNEILSAVQEEFQSLPSSMQKKFAPDRLSDFLTELLKDPGPLLLRRLRQLADSYSLLAFLRETPDVQKAVTAMFSHGEIWFDATIILPMLAESLRNQGDRPFSNVVNASRDAGMKLFVTSGILEEVHAHIQKCRAFYSTGSMWQGGTPFLAVAYTCASYRPPSFGKWIENFEGSVSQVDDLSEYLRTEFGIETSSLVELFDEATEELRSAAKEIWTQTHERRRNQSGDFDQHIALRLAQHDAECYVGVLQKRRAEAPQKIFGYRTWWLTLDGSARTNHTKVMKSVGISDVPSPVMSVDFLLNYLAFGPVKHLISRDVESTLPIMVDEGAMQEIPKELIDMVEKIRTEVGGLNTRLLQRRLRDRLNAAKGAAGTVERAGLQAIADSLRSTNPPSRLP